MPYFLFFVNGNKKSPDQIALRSDQDVGRIAAGRVYSSLKNWVARVTILSRGPCLDGSGQSARAPDVDIVFFLKK